MVRVKERGCWRKLRKKHSKRYRLNAWLIYRLIIFNTSSNNNSSNYYYSNNNITNITISNNNINIILLKSYQNSYY